MRTLKPVRRLTVSRSDPSARSASARSIVGWVSGLTADGVPLVDYDGNQDGPQPADLHFPCDAAAMAQAVQQEAAVALDLPSGDRDRLSIRGFVVQQPPGAPLRIDANRLHLEGRDEVVISCGEASITLRRNGKVVVRGAYVETHAKGTNRIKGGSVQIN